MQLRSTKVRAFTLGVLLAGAGLGFIATPPSMAKGGKGGGTSTSEGCPAKPKPGAPCPGGKAVGQFLADLLDQIKLTTAQEDQVDDALQADKDAIAAIEKQYKTGKNKRLTPKQERKKKQAIAAVHAQTRTAIEAILTDEQLEQLEALEAEKCPGKKGPKQPTGGTPSGGTA